LTMAVMVMDSRPFPWFHRNIYCILGQFACERQSY